MPFLSLVTLTFKLVRARDETHLCEFDTNPFSSSQDTSYTTTTIPHHTTTILRLFFRDHPGEPEPEENFWTLLCKERLTEADTLTIRLSATPSGLTSDHLHHLPHIFYRPVALPAAQPTQTNKPQTDGAENRTFRSSLHPVIRCLLGHYLTERQLISVSL